MNSKSLIDQQTLKNIANSLWLDSFNEDNIPPNILDKIYNKKNTNKAFAERFKQHIAYLKKHHLSHTTSYRKRYDIMLENSNNLSPQQNYIRTLFLGLESVVGYDKIPNNPTFNFPEIEAPQFKNQVGWHFFVGNAQDIDNNNYGIQVMFWQYTILPPPLAKDLGLSDLENQIIELHFAISDESNNIHYRAEPVVLSGTTGLIDFQEKPFFYGLGKNILKGICNDGTLFPLNIKACGFNSDDSIRIETDLYLKNNKKYLFQGENGCCPSIDGVGTLYYSASNLSLDDLNGKSNIKINDKTILLKSAKFWYDHQWGTGFMPSGAVSSASFRALQNLKTPNPSGWDWFMIHFDKDTNLGEIEITLAALHTHKNKNFYENISDTTPDKMLSNFKGKYLDKSGNSLDIKGFMTVSHWVRSTSSPNSKYYNPTNTWYPAKFSFTITTNIPEQYKEFDLLPIVSTGQTGFFANCIQYSEGSATVINKKGIQIGRGFAESTGYAKNVKNLLTNAKLPINEETLRFYDNISASLWSKIYSIMYALLHIKSIFKILKESKGL